MKKMNEVMKYRLPISLWSVVVTHFTTTDPGLDDGRGRPGARVSRVTKGSRTDVTGPPSAMEGRSAVTAGQRDPPGTPSRIYPSAGSHSRPCIFPL